jgi:hypothetical protein
MKETSLKLLAIAALLNCFAATMRGDALDNWTTAKFNTDFQNGKVFEMTCVTYGNGYYVAGGALGDFGVIETSEDGVNWAVRGDFYSNNPAILALYKVTFGNGTFVAVGYDGYGNYGNLYNSTNGINWTSHTNATVSNFNGVTYGNGLFVAVGDGMIPMTNLTTNRQIYTSPDGITWTARTSGPPASPVNTIWDVAYGAGKFVAMDGAGYIYTSTTGTSWTKRINSGTGYTISYCNDRFILPSGPGTNQISQDGVTWLVLTNNTMSTFRRLLYTNGLYVALSDSKVFSSTDMTNWIQRNFPANEFLTDIALGPHNVIVAGRQGSPQWAYKAFVSDPFVAVSVQPGPPPQLAISGLQGHSYRIDYLDGLQSGANNWQTLTSFSLTNSPLLWSGTTVTNAQRFYRAVLLP